MLQGDITVRLICVFFRLFTEFSKKRVSSNHSVFLLLNSWISSTNWSSATERNPVRTKSHHVIRKHSSPWLLFQTTTACTPPMCCMVATTSRLSQSLASTTSAATAQSRTPADPVSILLSLILWRLWCFLRLCLCSRFGLGQISERCARQQVLRAVRRHGQQFPSTRTHGAVHGSRNARLRPPRSHQRLPRRHARAAGETDARWRLCLIFLTHCLYWLHSSHVIFHFLKRGNSITFSKF